MFKLIAVCVCVQMGMALMATCTHTASLLHGGNLRLSDKPAMHGMCAFLSSCQRMPTFCSSSLFGLQADIETLESTIFKFIQTMSGPRASHPAA